MKGVILGIVGFVVGVFLFVFSLNVVGLINLQFWGAQYENTRREIFENTKSYKEGKKQDLIKYRLEYLKAESVEEKQAITSTIRMMFSNYNSDNLEPELKSFLQSIMRGEI